MSKESFSQKINNSMLNKMSVLENMDANSFFKKDDYFEIALCFAYMTLSKEKIISKDMKNTDRMARLTKKVDMQEIDKLFKEGFASEMPIIKYARVNNNLWILDNIRDSIMHGVFDIDEERNCFLINNNQYDRELVAEIPFSWFIAYAKNDILSKRIMDKYIVKGFYYNKLKKGKNYFDTRKELMNNILYNVRISGNEFNVKDIENRIRELFDKYSLDEVNNDSFEKYEIAINRQKRRYNSEYLLSFYLASEKVKNDIEKEFPGVNVYIYINNRKGRFINKSIKKIHRSFNDYDLLFDTFNVLVHSKGINLLEHISNIIENMNTSVSDDMFDNLKLFDMIFNKKSVDYNNNYNLSISFEQNIKNLRSVCLNVYGLSTLVINHESLYSNYFLGCHPSVFGIRAISKDLYYEYERQRKNIIMKILDLEINLFSKREQFNNCKDSVVKNKIGIIINELEIQINEYKNVLDGLGRSLGYERYINPVDFKYSRDKASHINAVVDRYFDHFNAARSAPDKRKVKKVLSKLLDEQIEINGEYTYNFCNNMNDVLTIIRNAFSHVGRVSIGRDKKDYTMVLLNDYDSNNKKTGQVTCRYVDLIRLLENPYQDKEKNFQYSKKI